MDRSRLASVSIEVSFFWRSIAGAVFSFALSGDQRLEVSPVEMLEVSELMEPRALPLRWRSIVPPVADCPDKSCRPALLRGPLPTGRRRERGLLDGGTNPTMTENPNV